MHTDVLIYGANGYTGALIARMAAELGLRAIAATDHNSTASVAALLAAGQRAGVGVVPGVEIDSGFGGKLWHTLIYGAAPDAPELLELCESVYTRNATDAVALPGELAA
ncbi:phosphotransferase, partial [Kouleothrix aurantiaca]